VAIQLPGTFAPTHLTDGLPGYPAVDLFGSPGDDVVAGFWGRVVRISGHPPSEGGRPHGPYGRSLYVHNAVNGWSRFITHLDELHVRVGDRVWPGRRIATVCDSAVSGLPGTTHVHLGLHR
jgi:murein DD-endopeptidase MepM/ murein hydrolase activator NlpD